MSAARIDDGGPAFPFVEPPTECNVSEGMSLRDHFAGLSLQGLLSEPFSPGMDATASTVMGRGVAHQSEVPDHFARAAYVLADAMLRARGSAPAAPSDLLAELKHMVRWHDQLKPADIERAKALIAKHEGGAV